MILQLGAMQLKALKLCETVLTVSQKKMTPRLAVNCATQGNVPQICKIRNIL